MLAAFAPGDEAPEAARRVAAGARQALDVRTAPDARRSDVGAPRPHASSPGPPPTADAARLAAAPGAPSRSPAPATRARAVERRGARHHRRGDLIVAIVLVFAGRSRLTPPAARASRPARCAPGTAAPARCRGPSRVHSVGDPNRSPTARRGRGRARARSAARAARNWATADALRANRGRRLKVVDRGNDFSLEPAAPPTPEGDGLVRYGAASAVHPPWTAPDRALQRGGPRRGLAGRSRPDARRLRAQAPAGRRWWWSPTPPRRRRALLAPGSAVLDPIAGTAPESSGRASGWATRPPSTSACGGPVAPSPSSPTPRSSPAGDAPLPSRRPSRSPPWRSPAASASSRPTSATSRTRRGRPSTRSSSTGRLPASRLRRVGPLDEGFAYYRNLDIWWSLGLRAGRDPGATPRGPRASSSRSCATSTRLTSLPDAIEIAFPTQLLPRPRPVPRAP